MSGLLIVRGAPHVAGRLASNPTVRAAFDRIVALGQAPVGGYDPWVHALDATIEDRALPDRPDRTRRLVEALIGGWGITHAIIMQPGIWYSQIAGEVCDAMGVRKLWGEGAWDGKIILDPVGMVYLPEWDGERHEAAVQLEEEITASPRVPQPPDESPEALRFRLGLRESDRVVPVFLQVPQDQAVAVPGEGGTGYYAWLDGLFEQNPDVVFIAKQHPLGATPGVERYPNVRPAGDCSTASLLRLAGTGPVASYSSSCIVEALADEPTRVVITGGWHAARRLTLHLGSNTGFDYVMGRARHDARRSVAISRRLAAVVNHYALRPDDPRILPRVLGDKS